MSVFYKTQLNFVFNGERWIEFLSVYTKHTHTHISTHVGTYDVD